MNATLEITSFNVRAGEQILAPPLFAYDVAVNCVVADGEHAVIKCLSPECKFTTAHRRAIIEQVEALGFKPKWYRANRKEWVMPAQKVHPDNLPHLSHAQSDKEILEGSQAWAAKVSSGDYTFVVHEEHAIDENTDLLVVVRRKVR